MLGDLTKIDFGQILSKSFFISGNTEIFYKAKTCTKLFLDNFLIVYIVYKLKCLLVVVIVSFVYADVFRANEMLQSRNHTALTGLQA